MNKPIVFSAALLASIVSIAVAQVQSNQQAGQVNPTGNQAQPNRQDIGPEHAQKCARDAASDNQFEIQAGQFVEQRAQDPQVKQFAQRLVQDHQQAQQQLQQLCQQAGIQVTQELTPVKQAMLQDLQQKQGQDLERHFVFGAVGGHEKELLMSQWQAQNEQNPQLKQYAQQQIPTLEEHLRMARQIADQWVPQARQAGERMPGTGIQGGVNNPDRTSGTTGGTSGTGRTTGR